MWANAQRDGRPAEHRWHPLFNAAILRHVLTIAKKIVKHRYLLHMSSQYGELLPTNG